jgi:hypothetical protein
MNGAGMHGKNIQVQYAVVDAITGEPKKFLSSTTSRAAASNHCVQEAIAEAQVHIAGQTHHEQVPSAATASAKTVGKLLTQSLKPPEKCGQCRNCLNPSYKKACVVRAVFNSVKAGKPVEDVVKLLQSITDQPRSSVQIVAVVVAG